MEDMNVIACKMLFGTVIGLDDSTFMLSLVPLLLLVVWECTAAGADLTGDVPARGEGPPTEWPGRGRFSVLERVLVIADWGRRKGKRQKAEGRRLKGGKGARLRQGFGAQEKRREKGIGYSGCYAILLAGPVPG
jgi:hypothetical protein